MLIQNYSDVRPVLTSILVDGELPGLTITTIDSDSVTVKVGDSPVQVELKLGVKLDAKVGDEITLGYDIGHITGIVTAPKAVAPAVTPTTSERSKPARRGCSEDTTLFRA
mgnify:CR=1 FL=1